MECPNCKGTNLQPAMTKQGVEIDYCKQCKGVWFDKGEIYYFTKYPKDISQKLEQALFKQKVSTRTSPRYNAKMVEISYPGGPKIDYCLETQGLWFDEGELKALLELEDRIHLVHAPTENKEQNYKPPANPSELIAEKIIQALPIIILALTAICATAIYLLTSDMTITKILHNILPLTLACIGLSIIARIHYSYPKQFFPEVTTQSLLKRVKRSKIKSVPCKIIGTIIHNNNITNIHDQTGDLKIKIIKPFFEIPEPETYHNEPAIVTGWYFHSPEPHITANTLAGHDNMIENSLPKAGYIAAILCIALGVLWGLL